MKESTDTSFFEVKRLMEIFISTIWGSILGKMCPIWKKHPNKLNKNNSKKSQINSKLPTQLF